MPSEQLTGINLVKQNQIYTGYSTWILSTTVDISLLQNRTNAISGSLRSMRSIFNNAVDTQISALDSDFHSNTPGINATVVLQQEKLRQAMQNFKERMNTLIDMEMMRTRTVARKIRTRIYMLSDTLTAQEFTRKKRGLFNLGGKILKGVFGTATESDLESLRKQLSDVAESQSEIAHVVRNSMTIVNKTIAQTNENTEAVNRLNGAASRLSAQLSALQNEVATVQAFIDLELRLTSFIETSLRHIEDALSDCEIAVEQIYTDLTTAVHGKLSLTLISPENLRQILASIQSQLPEAFFLKDFSGPGLLWFYENLKTMVLADSGQIHILSVIPLLQTDSLYTVYRISALPVPIKNEENKASKLKLESSYLAVSAATLSYVIWSLDDIVHCSNIDKGYCPLNEPYRVLARNPSCVSALFLKNPEQIHEFCEIEIINDQQYPVLDHLIEGTWAVSTNRAFYVQRYCGNQIRTLKIPEGISTIELPLGCSIQGDAFTLPPYYQETSISTVNVSDHIFFEHADDIFDLSDILISNDTFRISTQEIEHINLKNLSTLSNAPISSVLHEIDKIRRHRIIIENDSTFKIVFLVLLAICFIILCIAGTLYCVYRKRKSPNVAKQTEPENKTNENTKVAIELKQQKPEPVLIGSLMNIYDEETYL